MNRLHKMTCRFFVLASLLTISTTGKAQELTSPVRQTSTKAFSHLDLSLTTGSTGVGFDLGMPLNNTFSIRAGYAAMPHFNRTMHFGVMVGDDPTTSESKFNRLAGLLEEFTGNKVDNVVDMIGKPTYWNWKLLVDIKPLRNKHWHLTAGVFAGNKQVAEAVNSIEDMPSTMAVNMYNSFYYKAVKGDPFVDYGEISIYNEDIAEKLKSYGMMSVHLGDYKHDVYYDEDVYADDDMIVPNDEGGWDIYYQGDIIHHKGDVKYKEGDPYRMTPDESSMLRAWVFAKRLKPYLGFGYGGRMMKKDPRWEISFDCGALFWGGTPQVITHDGTDLVNDVRNVRGKVGDYIDAIKKFQVFPVLNLRITRHIF